MMACVALTFSPVKMCMMACVYAQSPSVRCAMFSSLKELQQHAQPNQGATINTSPPHSSHFWTAFFFLSRNELDKNEFATSINKEKNRKQVCLS